MREQAAALVAARDSAREEAAALRRAVRAATAGRQVELHVGTPGESPP